MSESTCPWEAMDLVEPLPALNALPAKQSGLKHSGKVTGKGATPRGARRPKAGETRFTLAAVVFTSFVVDNIAL